MTAKNRSMYLDTYLDAAAEHGWTPSTYLHYTLRGTAALYSARYLSALKRNLFDEEAAGRVKTVRSARGGTAYVRVSTTDG